MFSWLRFSSADTVMPASVVSLDTLLTRSDVWRGRACARMAEAALASGYAALDAELPGGGWPCGALSEVTHAACGAGEFSLFLPALRALDAEAGWIVLVAPPGQVHAPAWHQLGLPLSRLLVLEAAGADAAWACEQLLGSHALAALFAWLPAADARGLRRLQVAAGGTRSLCVVFRPHHAARQPSPAPLRISLAGTRAGLRVDIHKRRGPPLAEPLILPVERPLPWARLQRHLVAASPARAIAPAPA